MSNLRQRNKAEPFVNRRDCLHCSPTKFYRILPHHIRCINRKLAHYYDTNTKMFAINSHLYLKKFSNFVHFQRNVNTELHFFSLSFSMSSKNITSLLFSILKSSQVLESRFFFTVIIFLGAQIFAINSMKVCTAFYPHFTRKIQLRRVHCVLSDYSYQ